MLLEALPLLLLSAPPAQQALLADLAGTAAAEVASSSDPQLQAAAQQVAACLAACTQRQLEEQGSSSGSVAQQTLLALMAALQQLLLAAPAVAAAPAVSGVLQQLQVAADASMAGLMQAMQVPGEQQAGLQAVFQHLCQLRARLMLACAGAAAVTAGLASTAADGGETAVSMGSMETRGLHVVADSTQTTAQAWRSVLLMPPDVAAAAAAAASAAAGSSSRHPSRQQFFAAWVAATSYQQASSSAGWGSYGGCGSSGDGGSGTALALWQPPHQVEIPALPGVCFQPPALLATGTTSQSGAASGLEAAAEAAAAEVARDPDCLGPVHLTLAALQLAQRVAASGEGLAGGSAGAAATAAWSVLLELASGAAAMAGEPRQQRQLLLVVLHNQQAWPRRLREALAADAELQRSCRRELVAVANRLASGRPASGWLLSALAAADWCRRCHSCCASLATEHECSLHKQSLMPTPACFPCHRTRQQGSRCPRCGAWRGAAAAYGGSSGGPATTCPAVPGSCARAAGERGGGAGWGAGANWCLGVAVVCTRGAASKAWLPQAPLAAAHVLS